jgi:hypothetical protein
MATLPNSQTSVDLKFLTLLPFSIDLPINKRNELQKLENFEENSVIKVVILSLFNNTNYNSNIFDIYGSYKAECSNIHFPIPTDQVDTGIRTQVL